MKLHRRPGDLVERLGGHSPTNAPWRARRNAKAEDNLAIGTHLTLGSAQRGCPVGS
jgi:hypothetical protein